MLLEMFHQGSLVDKTGAYKGLIRGELACKRDLIWERTKCLEFERQSRPRLFTLNFNPAYGSNWLLSLTYGSATCDYIRVTTNMIFCRIWAYR